MPTSRESLLRHRAAHEGAPEHRRVWFFHSHAYFDHGSPERVDEARAFMERIRETFAGNAHVEVHSFVARPVGPHPLGSFEVLFTRDAFTEYVTWLSFERPEAIDIVIHPLTRTETKDHTTRALWLGKAHPLDVALLEAVDARVVATGRSEEDVIEGTKKH